MKPVDIILKKEVEENRTPSVKYLFFNKDSILHAFQYGFADLYHRITVNDQTTYNAYSVTKTFTALAVLQLAEQHKINIDQPANTYMPGFPYASNITIKQLLSHTAGIPNPVPLGWIHLPGEHDLFDSNSFFNTLFSRHHRLQSHPNERYAYSNLGYILLGQLIEEVSGLTYEQYIHTNIINQLDIDINELGFVISNSATHAVGYHKRRSFSNVFLGLFIDKMKYMDKSIGKWAPFKSFYVNGTAYGGLIGTPNAFMKYIQALLQKNSALISDKYKERLFTENLIHTHKRTGMCLSWFTGQINGITYFTHAGGGGGFYCEIRIYPQYGWGSVVMFNRTGMYDERFLNKVDKYIIDSMRSA